MFTVVVGVAAIVGLLLTADVLESSLTTSVRTLMKGDIAVTKSGVEQAGAFTDGELAAVQELLDDGAIDGYTVRGNPSDFADFVKFKTSVVGRTDKDAVISFFTPVFFERDVYPYYGHVGVDGQGLWELMQGDYDVLITRNLANRHDIDVGDGLKLSGVDQEFTVQGILSPDALGLSGDPLSGNVVFGLDTIERLFPDLEDPVTEVYILAPDASDEELAVIDERLESISPLIESTTPAELESDNQDAADNLRSVILVFGFVAMAIGGMGIANTMQVLVSRRLPEAGVLKAIGLKGRQVMLVFLTEALIIGVVGSVLGVLLGLGISYFTVRVMEGLIFIELPWRIGVGPIVAGLVVGIVVTLAFGLLPAVGAGRVRPMAAIRPDDGSMVRRSWRASILLLLLLGAVLGVIAGVLIGSVQWGIIGTYGAFVGVGILLLILIGIVYLLSRLPSFGKLTLQLSFLEWRRRKTRAASLLLAMSIGILGISLVLMLADTFISGLTGAVEDAVGGDIVLAVNDPDETARAFAVIRAADGVALFSPGIIYETRLASINGDKDGFDDRISEFEDNRGAEVSADRLEHMESYFSSVTLRAIDRALPVFEFLPDDGRMLNESDTTRNTIVLQTGERSYPADLGLGVGDVLGFQVLDRSGEEVGEPVEFEIIGIADTNPISVSVFGWISTAHDPFAEKGLPSMLDVGTVQVGDGDLDELVRTLNLELDSVLVLEVGVFTDLFAELLKQFRTFPLVLSGLALLAAVVIIANAVALSTIERRKEIGLLKSMGAQARWITVQLVVENSLLGFIGGVIGLGLAIAGLLAITSLLGIPLVTSPVIIVGVLVLTILLTSSVTLFSAVPAARERPLDILRGE